MSFAKWAFRLAGIYGVIVLAPLLIAEPTLTAQSGPVTYPEFYYGFAGSALVFQALFLLISTDPARYRSAMLIAVAEKVCFPAAVWPLYLSGRTHGPVVVFASIDAVLAVVFATAYLRTRPAAA
jgi:hypothetical protein